MDALSDGVDIKRSLNNWRMYRAQLATTVQGFLTACTDLGSVCARASRQPYGRKDLNSALTDIDVELESLASEAESLRSARRSLATTRNLSTALTPIHTLPPEILTRIFMRVPTYEFTGISSYWRWIALTTPSLWTYLDITNQNNFDYGYLSLDRSDGLPLYFYISGYFDESDRQDRQLGFFLEAAPQISTLDIKSRSYNFPGAGMSMLRTWLGNSPVKGTKMLRILLVHDGSGPVPQWDQLLLFEYAEPVLSALTVLHLDNFHIPWPSAAYHDLVDLRLSIGSCHNAQATVSQLAHVFAASPGLSTLKLNGLKVVSSGDWDATKITTLIHLEVLCLLDMDDESLKLIMLLIPLSRCLGELSIGLKIRDDLLPIAQDFLRGSCTKWLACAMHHGSDSIWWPFLLSAVVPSLEHLVIHDFRPFTRPDVGALSLELERYKGEGRLNEELRFCVPHVYLASSIIDEGGIMAIAQVLNVHTLHVEGGHRLNSQGKLDELDTTLLEALPKFVRLSPVDTTARWPCRVMFD